MGELIRIVSVIRRNGPLETQARSATDLSQMLRYGTVPAHTRLVLAWVSTLTFTYTRILQLKIINSFGSRESRAS